MKYLALAALLLFPGTAAGQQQSQPTLPKNIVQTAVEAGQFKTLATALEKAGLLEALSGKGPFTVFAPTDAAFAKLPEGTIAELLEEKNKARLKAILTYHVIAGKVDAANALQSGAAKTLQGDLVRVTLADGQLNINDAKMIENDVPTSNGIIHIIDTVLLPPAPTELKEQQMSRTGAIRAIIIDAIEAGVPLFNAGQAAACTAIYRLAAFSVLNLGGEQLSKSTKSALDKALRRLSDRNSAVDKAWILRQALDQTLLELSRSESTTSSTKRLNRLQTKELFSFETERDQGWRSVNDDVMGGISQGRMIFNASQQTASFAGALSLQNNGGFSTVRSVDRDLGLTGFEGLILRVRGDGRSYRLQAQVGSERRRMGSYRKTFATTKGEWQEVRVPFAEMGLNIRGRSISSEPIEGSDVRSIGFSIADKNESPFELEIDWIKAYRQADYGSADLASSSS